MKRLSLIHLPLVLAASAATADDARWDRSANLELQSRLFTEDAAWVGQDDTSLQWSLTGEFELRSRGEQSRTSVIARARYDSVDPARNLLDLPEAYWALEGDDYELLIGVNTVFWGVTESLHLVDIINQSDFVSDIDGEDKLGQPMVNLVLQRDWGELSFYLMPYFRERRFPGEDGRFRFPELIDFDGVIYESSAKEYNVDVAARYSHFFGDVDVGLSFFDGTSREPRYIPGPGTQAIPIYDQITQFGVDVQLTRDAWLWKLEAISRQTAIGTFFATVGGFEYTFYQVTDAGADLGVLVEYQYDDRGIEEPFIIADNDLFSGVRLALNDIQDTALLAGFAYDTNTGETFVSVEGERRLGNDWFFEIRARFFTGADPGEPLYVSEQDDYLQLQIARFF